MPSAHDISVFTDWVRSPTSLNMVESIVFISITENNIAVHIDYIVMGLGIVGCTRDDFRADDCEAIEEIGTKQIRSENNFAAFISVDTTNTRYFLAVNFFIITGEPQSV